LSTVLALVESQKPPANLNNELSKKSHPIDMAERSRAQLLLLSAAALLVPFGEFYDAMDIERQNQQRSRVLQKP